MVDVKADLIASLEALNEAVLSKLDGATYVAKVDTAARVASDDPPRWLAP